MASRGASSQTVLLHRVSTPSTSLGNAARSARTVSGLFLNWFILQVQNRTVSADKENTNCVPCGLPIQDLKFKSDIQKNKPCVYMYPTNLCGPPQQFILFNCVFTTSCKIQLWFRDAHLCLKEVTNTRTHGRVEVSDNRMNNWLEGGSQFSVLFVTSQKMETMKMSAGN